MVLIRNKCMIVVAFFKSLSVHLMLHKGFFESYTEYGEKYLVIILVLWNILFISFV